MTPTNHRISESRDDDTPATESILEIDWAATPLGPRESWDPSLSSSVEMMLDSSAATALAWGPDLTILFNDAWAMSAGGQGSLGRAVAKRQDAPWPELAGSLEEVRRNGRAVSVSAETGGDFRILPIFGETGGAAGVWIRARRGREEGVLRDDTEFAALQRKQRAMRAELQHRVRNMLAVIRSLVRRSADSADDIEGLASHLEGRIGALARLQTIGMQDPKGGVDLETLLREELLHAAAGDDQAHLSGPKVSLPARTAQAISMTFHELTTNALKFGALSEPHGALEVTWRRDAGELAISWQEHGAPLPDTPTHSGVGLEQLGRVLPYETGARVSYDFSADGFRCTIALELPPTSPDAPQE